MKVTFEETITIECQLKEVKLVQFCDHIDPSKVVTGLVIGDVLIAYEVTDIVEATGLQGQRLLAHYEKIISNACGYPVILPFTFMDHEAGQALLEDALLCAVESENVTVKEPVIIIQPVRLPWGSTKDQQFMDRVKSLFDALERSINP